MKQKVVVNYKDGGRLIYKGYANKDDFYFINNHRFSSGIKNITRQYYPLKNNEKVVIFSR